jgi:hypothetical protein
MAKAQSKKAAVGAKKSAAKKAAAPKPAAKKAAAKKPASKPSAKPAPKKAAAKKPAAKPAAAKKAAPKKVSQPAKKAAPAKKPQPKKAAAPKPMAKKATPAKKAAAAPKPAPKKAVQPAAPVAQPSKAKTVAKNVAKGAAALAAGAAAGAAAVPALAKVAKAVTHAVEEKKRTRRPRTRVTSNGPAVANWFSQEKARPSSFIPAPPRAEAPSLVAAPPASSDRLIRPEELHHSVVRTVPVRVDIEQGGGRVFIAVNPQELALRPNEGIEWDFRYLGGADVTVDEIVIEFDRPSPFGTLIFRSRKPGAARPHRQLSGAASPSAAGKRVQYTIRANTAFKQELANTKPFVNVLS